MIKIVKTGIYNTFFDLSLITCINLKIVPNN